MGDLTGTITISGGEVNAFGNGGGAGIGSGYQSNALKGTVTITGGKVCAISTSKAAGIGGGCEGMFEVGGEGANVSISGNADVIAWSGGGKSSAIGHGDNDREYGTLSIAPGMSVKAGWSDTEAENADPFPSDERVNACQYRWFAHIKPCDHPSREFSITDTQHSWQCKYCGRYFLMTTGHRQLYCQTPPPGEKYPCYKLAKNRRTATAETKANKQAAADNPYEKRLHVGVCAPDRGRTGAVQGCQRRGYEDV
jgi:hypothetical protein